MAGKKKGILEGFKGLLKKVKPKKRTKPKAVKPTTPAKPKAAPKKVTPKTTPKVAPKKTPKATPKKATPKKATPKVAPKVAPKKATPKSDTRPFFKKKRFIIPGVIGGASLLPGDGDDKKSKDDKKEGSNASMSFDQAFKSARKEMGTDKVFTWRGKKYSTVTMDEVKKAGFKTLAEYNANKRSKSPSKATSATKSTKATKASNNKTTKTRTNPGMDYDPTPLKDGGSVGGGRQSRQNRRN